MTDLPNRAKDDFIPPLNMQVKIGERVFTVTHRNVGKLRFTLTFVGIAQKSRILKPTDMPKGKSKLILPPGAGH